MSAFSAARLFAAALVLTPGLALAEGAKVSVDWPGQYSAVVPCADCPGIEMTLKLNENGTYELLEVYQEKADGTFREAGKFTWDAAGNVITLDDADKRMFFVSEGRVFVADESGQPSGDEYALTQMSTAAAAAPAPAAAPAAKARTAETSFVGAGANLTIDPQSIATSKMEDTGDSHVVFDGVMNFEHKMEGGHKSLSATFDINCTKQQVDMPVVAYFAGEDAQGGKIGGSDDNSGNWIDLVPAAADGDSDVLTQAAAAYCPAS